jgi:hypothetical protein
MDEGVGRILGKLRIDIDAEVRERSEKITEVYKKFEERFKSFSQLIDAIGKRLIANRSALDMLDASFGALSKKVLTLEEKVAQLELPFINEVKNGQEGQGETKEESGSGSGAGTEQGSDGGSESSSAPRGSE